MFTSWSEVSTPAELSIASVLTRTPLRAASTRPSWVRPRLPPSPTTRLRRSLPLMRIRSFALSPTSAFVSDCDFTYVPMPPFHRRSTGARRAARMSSSGVRDSRPAGRPRADAISGLIRTDFSDRANTPPPAEMSDGS